MHQFLYTELMPVPARDSFLSSTTALGTNAGSGGAAIRASVGQLVDTLLTAAAGVHGRLEGARAKKGRRHREKALKMASGGLAAASAHPSAVSAAARGLNPYKIRLDATTTGSCSRATKKIKRRPRRHRGNTVLGATLKATITKTKNTITQSASSKQPSTWTSSNIWSKGMFSLRHRTKAQLFLKHYRLRDGSVSGSCRHAKKQHSARPATAGLLRLLWRKRRLSPLARFGRGGCRRRHAELFLLAVGKTFARARTLALQSMMAAIARIKAEECQHQKSDATPQGPSPLAIGGKSSSPAAAVSKLMPLFPLVGLRVRLVLVDPVWASTRSGSTRHRLFNRLARRRGIRGVVALESSNTVGVIVQGAGGVVKVTKLFPGSAQLSLPPRTFSGWVCVASNSIAVGKLPQIL